MVLKEAMTLTAIGVAIGLAGASGTTRFFSSFLYGIQPTDAFTFCGCHDGAGCGGVRGRLPASEEGHKSGSNGGAEV